MTYDVSSLGYLRRAGSCLGMGTDAGLVYAAVELRSGIEARLREYIDPHEHIPARRKKDYRISVLGGAADSVSLPRDKVMRLRLFTPGGEALVDLWYTPVTKRLRKSAENLGDLLHAMRQEKSDTWWTGKRRELEETYLALVIANSGSLLGAATLDKARRNAKMEVVLPADTAESLKRRKGSELIIKVEHLEEVPRQQILAFIERAGLRMPELLGA